MRKLISFIIFLSLSNLIDAQSSLSSKEEFEFVELSYGVAKVVEGTSVDLKKSPSGTRGILSDFVITKVTDSVLIEPKANFGVLYIINSKETIDIDVEIEWIYPEKIKTKDGKKIKSLKYTMRRPTNTENASSYSLDGPEEMVKGEWTINIYLHGKLMHTRKFLLYN